MWDASHLRLPDDVRQKLFQGTDLNDAPSLDQLRDKVLGHWPELMSFGAEILNHTKNSGYLVIRNFPFTQLNSEARRLIFFLLTSSCGTPVSHIPGKNEYLWEIAPKDVHRQLPTYSENDLEAPLHTDSNYRDNPEEFIAVLVERPSRCGGGRTILLRIRPVLKQLQETDEGRQCLDILRNQKFPSMVPSVYRETDVCVKAPIIIGETVRFRPDTIDQAIKKEQNFPEEQRRAIDYFADLVDRSPDRLGVFLKQGDMLFINNYTVLHGRTAFQDNERLLLRIRFNSATSS